MLLLVLLLASAPAFLATPRPKNEITAMASKEPEIWMECDAVIQRWGYPVEQYDVTTDDGYILTMFRIVGSRNNLSSPIGPKPVVFLQHGLECSSYDWVINLPNESAGFVLADNGMDVWLGNFRGNMYGKRHVTLSNKSNKFWEFSFDEMAEHDLPAMINRVLEITNTSSLHYIGHSMGTTAAFAKLSRDKAFGKKIKTFYALAPVTTVKHIKGAFRWIAPMTKELDDFFKLVGYNEFLPSNEFTHLLAEYFCGSAIIELMCECLTALICGPDSHQTNATRMGVYIAHSPAGTSTQTVAHYGQAVNNGKFEMYDYGGVGGRKNKEHYGQSKPPQYDVAQVDVPIYLFWADNDWLADPKDVENLIPKLRNVVGNVYLRDFNHLDFIWGLRAAPEIYWPIIRDIRQKSNA